MPCLSGRAKHSCSGSGVTVRWITGETFDSRPKRLIGEKSPFHSEPRPEGSDWWSMSVNACLRQLSSN